MKLLAAACLAAPAAAAVLRGDGLSQQLTFGSDAIADARQWLLEHELETPRMQVLPNADWNHPDEFEIVTMAGMPDHSLRVKSHDKNKGDAALCDPGVKQHSGYLDVSDSRHLFFWMFESRGDPKNDPLVLWLNGGPGCSSSTGLLFELGPCNVRNNGTSTEQNPYSWNERANIIFLDQPIAVGFSYADNGESVNNSPDSAKDVYAFLQLFYSHFQQYSKLPFHVAAESYGGTYAPNIGHYIHEQNLKVRPQTAPVPSAHHIPLASLIIGNGLSEPYTQFASVPDFACAPSKTAIFDESTCRNIRSKVPTCQRLQKFCYNTPSRFSCTPAGLYCWQNVAGPIGSVPINPYDVRRKCERDGEDGPLCYKQMGWIETYLNQPEVKKTLGAPAGLTFESCNMRVNQAFMLAGDGMHNSAALLPPLLEAGIKVLIYAGDQDFMCNWIGNKRWVLDLDSPFKEALNSGKDKKWHTLESNQLAGEVRTSGHAGNFTYVRVFDAGHMVPYDQPEVALDLFGRWIADVPLVSSD